MTTMTTERVTLPMAGLRRTLTAGLEEGTSQPYLAVDTGAPAGYSGCLIMPAGTTAGWAIERGHVAPLHPYIGMRGWWVRRDDIEITAVVSDIERPAAPEGDERIPAEHRLNVPEGAYWARMTRSIDGMPQLAEVLAMDVASRGNQTLLMFWPDHPQWRIATTDRPGLPPGWRGWWAHGAAERIGEVLRGATAIVDRPDLPIEVGTRVRVLRDADQATNNGSLAEVLEVRQSDRYAPYRVRYEADAPHATVPQKGPRGWWVNEVVAVAAEAEHEGPFPVGHWFSWGSRDSWYRVARVEGDTVHTDRRCQYGRIEDHVDTRRTNLSEVGAFICLPPGHVDMPAVLREATARPAHAHRFPVGDWYSWGTQQEWHRIAEVTDTGVRFDLYCTATGGVITHTVEFTVANMTTFHDRPVHFPPGHASLPTNVRLHGAAVAEVPEFAEGVRVLLTSRHIMQPRDTMNYTEARRGVGFATGVLNRRATTDGAWHLTWDNGGNASVVHESCLTPLPTRRLAMGDKVILVTPHTTGSPYTPGGHQYGESPNGVGSIGILDRDPSRTDDWGVRWLNDDGSEARHSRVHASCLMVYPDVEIEAPVPEPVAPLAVGQRVEVYGYGHGWDGPGVIEVISGDSINVRLDDRGRTGGFDRRFIRPIEDPEVPPMVPEGARRVRFTGRGAGRVTDGHEYMAIRSRDVGTEGMHLLLAWPGHPEHRTMAEHEGRRGVPDGWKSFRTGSITDLGAWSGEPEHRLAVDDRVRLDRAQSGWESGTEARVTYRPGGDYVSLMDDAGREIGGVSVSSLTYLPPVEFTVGQAMTLDNMRTIRGLLLDREYNEGELWVSHGDGTLSRIAGHPQRMGVGERHPVYGPTDSWVSDRWRYAGMDLSRVPADPGAEVPPNPEVPPMVPEGAMRVRYNGTSRSLTRGGEYMALVTGGTHLILVWPGHPSFDLLGARHRTDVPDGWRSYRSTMSTVLGPWVEPEPVVGGYEGVPEEHWDSVPEGAIKVRHSVGGGEREWMAIPHNESPRMHILIAWPGHPVGLGVAADNGTRLRQGVPAGWTSWAVTLRAGQNLGAWPRVQPAPEGDVEVLRARLAEVERQYAEDLARIADIMKEEAEERDWCGEYEDVSRRIDRAIHGTFNGERPVGYEVLFSTAVPLSGRVVLNLPAGATDGQVQEALNAYFAENSLAAHGATLDWSAVADDLHVDEFDLS